MKERLYSVLKQTAVFLIAGAIYYLIVTLSDYKLGFKCPIFELTGFMCPSCGVSRMIVALLHLDFKSAYSYNEAMFCLMPIYSTTFIHYILRYIIKGKSDFPLISTIIVSVATVILIVFGIFRNLT